MFIKSIKAKNFGKLKSASHDFVNGINILRGGNEQGKSTLIEACLYAMFGTSALRGTIEETVTDGMKPADLKVELEYGPYKVKRSKSSASVVGDGVKINGQGQVSNFFYELLGVSKGTETSVLVSEQGKTAGILDGKPGEVSSLIENLAGFSQIDDLIERLKEKFPSGNKALLEEMVEEATGQLAEKKGETLESPTAYLQQAQSAEAYVVVLAKEINALRSKESEHKEDIARVEASVKLKEKLVDDIEKTKAKIDLRKIEKADAVTGSLAEIPDTLAEESLVKDYPGAVEERNLYEKINSFSWEGDTWEGDVESLEAEIESERAAFAVVRKRINSLDADIRMARKVINSEDTCPTCKQGTKHLHEEINKKAEDKISEAEKEKKGLMEKSTEHDADLVTMLGILEAQNLRTQYEDYAVYLEELPWTLECDKWDKAEPVKPSAEKFDLAQATITKVTKAEMRRAEAAKAIETISERITEFTEELRELDHQNNQLFIVDSGDTKLILASTQKALAETLEKYGKVAAEALTASDKAKELQTAVDYRDKEVKALEEKIVGFKEKLLKDSHNALLLNHVRKAKPLVLNKVWSSVLASVSSTFSEMRGEESSVIKTEKGFKVNGLPVVRLSGSAKSILGIALRASLRDIFAPQAGFLSLDEVASDCDEERTAMVTAAVASIRGQVLMITHEDLSDSVADKIIEI